MERSPSYSSFSNQQTSLEEQEHDLSSETRVARQETSDVDNEAPPKETALERASNPSEFEEREKSRSRSSTSPPAEQEEPLAPDTDEQLENKGEEPETQMSYPGDYYHYSRMSSGQSEREKTTSSTTNRRPDTSRSSTNSGSNSSASTPRQGSEVARDNKKDDRSGSGGGSGSASTTGGGSGSGSTSGSSRSRLVAGVFVRY